MAFMAPSSARSVCYKTEIKVSIGSISLGRKDSVGKLTQVVDQDVG